MLKNSIALITGCASGLGRATLIRCLEEGAKVVGVDIKESGGYETMKSGSNLLLCQADLSDEKQVEECMEKIAKEHGHLDIVVNCAGIAATTSMYSPSKWTLDKFNTADNLIQKTPTEDGERGVIINTSGFAATEGVRAQTFFAGVNGAINSMTLPLARELQSEGIRVVTISPGIFETPILGIKPPHIKDFLISLQAYPHRLGEKGEFADHVVNVVSNKLLNGVVIRLDAGLRTHF